MPNTPYDQHRANPAWAVLQHAIAALVDNKDIVEATNREHIVGYLVKSLVESGVLEDQPSKPAA